MKSRFLPVALLLFSVFFFKNLNAQTNYSVEIVATATMCLGQCDTIYAMVNNGPVPGSYTYVWSVNGVPYPPIVSPDNATKFFFCAQTSGSYLITVTVTNANGVSATDSHTITVVSYQPLDILSSNPAPCNSDSLTDPNTTPCEKVCPNITVTYSVQTSGNPGGQSYLIWQVQGANSYTVNPPYNNSVTVNWGGPGVGSVSVISDGIVFGCSGEDALCVTIIQEPAAKFTADPSPAAGAIQICKGQTVYFENQSTGADGYEWLFGDDLSTSIATDPQHTFFTPGNFTVRLIARSDCLCADTTTLNVQVLDALAPDLGCVGTICPGETITYTASNVCPPYNWVVTPNGTVLNGGTATIDSITVQWSAGPEGIVTLGGQPCSGLACPTPANIHVPIVSDDAEIRGEDRVCPASVEVYTIDPYGGTGFVWTLSGGGNITEGQGTNRVTVAWTDLPDPGTTYWLSVVYDNCYLGCGGQDSIAVKVLSPFVINGPVERCEGANGNFTSKLSYNNQNIACNWALYAPNGAVAWTSPSATAAATAPFTSGGGIYRLFAIPADPTQTCTDEADWAVNISALPAQPTGILGEKNICPNTTYTYEAAGVSPTNNLRWTVQNGPGSPVVSFENKINVTWGNTAPRWISVAQISTNGLNCASDTALLTMQSIGLIVINGALSVCEDATVNYSILSLENVDIQWKITHATAGAVANGQGTNAVEIFWTEAGGHVVSVDVCGQIADNPVTVIAPPNPMVQHSASVCPGLMSPVQTTTPYSTYSWRDAAGVELATTPTIALGPGSYSVLVEDPNGCPGAAEFTVAENPAPNVSITTADPTIFCNNTDNVTLTALTNADGNFTFQWFQNGTPVGTNAPTLTTNQAGNYTVQVTTANGCTDSAGPIVLFIDCSGGGGGGFPGAGDPPCPPGSVDFTVNATPACDSFHFQLNASPLYLPGSAQWTFGISGGAILGTSTQDNPGFHFPNAGKYIAVLRAGLTNGSFCAVIDSVSVTASAQFSALPDCAGEATNFQDAGTFLPGSGIAEWDWVFGDPPSGAANVSDLRNPMHLYFSSGNPVVTLTITANNGCTSSVSQTLAIPGAAPADFSPPPLQCAGNALEFTAIVTPEMTEVAWNFGDLASGAANDATGSPAYHSFTSPGNYAITTTSKNAYGCTAVFTKIISIAPNVLSGLISPASPAPICEGTTVTLTAPPGAVSYLWSDSTTTTQTFVADEEGSYSVTLTDASGCTYAPPPVNVEITPGPDVLIKALLENELGQIIGTSYPTLSSCDGEKVHLLAQANGSYTYSWSGGNGSSNEVVFSEEHNTLLVVGTHIFTVTVTDAASGCTSVADPFVVTVNPVPSSSPITANGFCAGDANVLTYSGPTPPNWQFIWNNGAPGTSLVTENPGLYYIRIINEFGCETKSAPLTILPGPNVAAIPGGCHTRCRPDTICLPVIPNIVSWQWFFNGSPIAGATGPDFVATQSGSYYAELTDIFGCTSQSDPLSLNLYDGLGTIQGQVWSDVNDNGSIDAGDTLVSGIAVNLLQNGSPVGAGQSAANGGFSFTNILSTNSLVEIDSALLSNDWQIVIGQNALVLFGCNATDSSDLLLKNCPATGSALLINVCPNEVYSYNGTLLLPGQTQGFVFQNFQGCDSVVTVSVFQVNESDTALSVSVCANSFYNYNGTMLMPGQTQDFHFQNLLGCDSTVTVSVSALPVSSSTLAVSVCPGTTYDYNGTLLSAGQTEDFILTSLVGCDSTVTVTVAESPTEYFILDAFVCPGGSFFFNGVSIPANSLYTFNYLNSWGCDSIVAVAVGEIPSSGGSTLMASVCPGEVFTYQNTQLAAGQTADFVLQNMWGCDSTVTVTVTGLSASASAMEAKVCPGETFSYQGLELSAGQVWDFTFDNWVGCDSVVTVTVTELPVAAELLEVEACPGTTYNFNGTEIPAGDTAVFHFIGPEGCDSAVTVVVHTLPEATFDLQPESSCATSPTGSLSVTGATGGLPPYRYSLDGTAFQYSTLFDKLAAGNYTVYLEDSNGCIFEKETTVDAFPRLVVEVPDGILPCDNSGTRLEAFASGDLTGLKFKWVNGDTTSFITVADPGSVWVEATNHCETVRGEAAVNWADVPNGTNYLYVPNVFKPASTHPDNSAFRPYFQPNLTVLAYQFEVYDRWGNRLFGTGQPDAAWRGDFRADEMNPGVYVWFVKARVLFCGRERDLMFKGDVTVVR